jgi:hypothetical protein
MKSLKTLKGKGDSEEALQVQRMEKHLKMADNFVQMLAKAAIAWVTAIKSSTSRLGSIVQQSQWSIARPSLGGIRHICNGH